MSCVTSSGISTIQIISWLQQDGWKIQREDRTHCCHDASEQFHHSPASVVSQSSGTCRVGGCWQLSEGRTESSAEPGDICSTLLRSWSGRAENNRGEISKIWVFFFCRLAVRLYRAWHAPLKFSNYFAWIVNRFGVLICKSNKHNCRCTVWTRKYAIRQRGD